MASPHERTGALEAVERILNRGGDAGEVLRAVLRVLSRLYAYVGLSFVGQDRIVRGPHLGAREENGRAFPISFRGTQVAELHVCHAGNDPAELAFLERVATLVSAHCSLVRGTRGS
jgi:hypothetical protein